jgi:hypothetical protein
MKKVIWKFTLETTDNQVIEMPIGAEILTVQMQGSTPCLWALVNPDVVKEQRRIEIYGTGHEMRYDMRVNQKYIGTYQLAGGGLVFHVFEILN